jgi:hypothetical protein
MKLNKRLKELTSKIDNLESEIKSIKKIVKRPTCNQPMVIVVPPVVSRKLQDFYCGPDKSASGSSTVNALVKNFGINQNGIMTFKTGYISSFGTFYNGKDLSLSVTSNHVILHINKMRVRAWSINRVLKNLNDKNPYFYTTRSELKEMVLNGSLVTRFNVSAIKDHGTYWKIK